MTGLPFVWAVWAGRAGAASPARLPAAARDAAARGRQHRRHRPARTARRSGRAERSSARYLRDTITYGLDESLQAGPQAYFDGLAEEGSSPGRRACACSPARPRPSTARLAPAR